MEIVDLLAIVVPGMCSGVTLNKRIDNFVKLSRNNVQPLDQNSEVLDSTIVPAMVVM